MAKMLTTWCVVLVFLLVGSISHAQGNGTSAPASANGANGAAAAKPATAAEALEAIEKTLRGIESARTKLYNKVDEALEMRRSLPAIAGVDTAVAPIDAATREAREDQLTLEIAQFREYKRMLIGIYDLISDEWNPSGPSLNAQIGQLVDGASDFEVRFAASVDAGADEALKAKWGSIRSGVSSVAEFCGHSRPAILPREQRIGVEWSSPRFADQAVAQAYVPTILSGPVENLPSKNATYGIIYDKDLLLGVQAAIDPIEQAEMKLEAEYMQLVASRMLNIDSGVGSTSPAPVVEAAGDVSEPARIRRQIERRESYRDSLVSEFRQAALRYLRQLTDLGEQNPAQIIQAILDSPDSTRGVSPTTGKQLKKVVDEILADLAKPSNTPPLVTEPRLVSELAAWTTQLDELAKPLPEDVSSIRRTQADVRYKLLSMQYRGKDLRHRNLLNQISRERALNQVARTRLVGHVQGIMMIDDRVSALEEQWVSAAWRFYGWAIAKVLVILVAAWILIRIVKLIAVRVVNTITTRIAKEIAEDEPERLRDLTQRAKTLSGVFMATVGVAVWVTALLMVLGQFEVNYQPLLLATGGVTLAIGFGAQSLVKDFFSGFFILLENQFQVGDVVDINGMAGGVEAVSLRTTRIRSADGNVSIIPNGEIKAITNMTHLWSRISINVGVGYVEDPEEVQEVINRVGREMFEDPDWKNRLIDAPTVLGLDAFGASSIDFRVVAKTRPGEQWAATRELRKRLKVAFDIEGIEIPYNYVNYVPAKVTESKVLKHQREGAVVTPSDESKQQSADIGKLRVPDGGN